MSLAKKIALNTGWQMVGKVVGTFLGLIAIAILTRYLGTEGYGQYTTIYAFLQLFGILADFGLYIVLVKKISERDVDKDKEQKLVSNIFTLRLISALIFLGVAPIVGMFFPYPFVVKLGILITSLFFLFTTLNQAMSGVFQKYMAMYKVAIAEMVGKIALVGAIILVVFLKLDLLWVMACVSFGAGVNFFLTFFYSRQYVKIKLVFDKILWKEIIRDSWPIAISISLNLIYFKADTVILSIYQSDATVGLYGAPYKMLEVLISFPAMFVGLLLPILTIAWTEGNKERFKRVLQKGFDFLMIIALPMIAATVVLANPIMTLVAGEDFASSGPILAILIFAVGSIFLGTLYGYLVVVINKQKTMIASYIFVAVTALIAYFVLIPKFSYWAAAGITIYSEALIMLLAFYIVTKHTKVYPKMASTFKALIASLIMAIVLYFLISLNVLLLILIGMAVYLFIMFITKGLTKNMVMEIFKPVKIKNNE